MRISPQYGTKEKLFEMFNKINHLNENLSNSQEDKSEIIDNFIRYVGKKLNIDNKLLKKINLLVVIIQRPRLLKSLQIKEI